MLLFCTFPSKFYPILTVSDVMLQKLFRILYQILTTVEFEYLLSYAGIQIRTKKAFEYIVNEFSTLILPYFATNFKYKYVLAIDK